MITDTTQPRCECGGAFCGEGGVMHTLIGCLVAAAFGVAVAFQIGGEG